MATNTCLQEFLQRIAEAIRCKCGKNEVICAQDFATLIEQIEPIYDEIEITGNNTVNVTDYKLAKVNVPGTEEYQQFIAGTLKEIIIPDGITKIRQYFMFQYPQKIERKTIKIPTSVTEIEDHCFNFSDSKDIYFSGNLIEWILIKKYYESFANSSYNLYLNNELLEHAIIPSDIGTKIPDFSFRQINSLKTLTISEGIEELGRRSIDGHSKLTELKLPSTLKIIGDYTLANYQSLQEMTIPANVTNIGTGAISPYKSNFVIYMEPTTPPTLSSSISTSNLKAIYVPVGTRTAYITATNWSRLADYIYEPNQVILQVPSTLLNNENYTYSLDNGQTWEQFNSSSISLQYVRSIMFNNKTSENRLLLGTTDGGSEIGSISNATIKYDTLGDLTIYITVQ